MTRDDASHVGLAQSAGLSCLPWVRRSAVVAEMETVDGNCGRQREVMGMPISISEVDPIWTVFLHRPTRRGLRC